MNTTTATRTEANADTAAQTLARWEAEEAAVVARLAPHAGVARPEQVLGQPGMALFDAIFSGAVPRVPIGETLGFLPIHIEPGRAVFQGRPSFKVYNPMGAVHGGWFATLLDSVLGCCIHAALPAGKGYTTLELKVNMIRALTDRVPLVRAEGQIIHLGGQTATAEARIVGPDGKLYGHGSTTCLVFDMPAKPKA
jgi:uncharacterized protein (TIGR00369 family)